MAGHGDSPRSGGSVLPARYQPELPWDRLIRQEAPDPEAVPMDVVFVGGGPAGLAGAIELARLVKKDKEAGGGLGDVEIGVLEKAETPRRPQPLGRGREPVGAARAVPGAQGRGLPAARARSARSASTS